MSQHTPEALPGILDALQHDGYTIVPIYVEENLDSIYRPIKFFFVDSFPLTKLGKVDYRALEEIAAKNMN